jgi:hypothetical protein
MGVFKSTIFFDIRAHGWTETYWQSLADNNFGQAMSNLTDLARARALVLGQEASIKAIRISLEGTNNDGWLQYLPLKGVLQQTCADQDLGVLCTMKDITLQRTKNVWIKGFWDAVEDNAGTYIRNLAGWQKAFAPFLAFFGAPKNITWGWWGTDYTTKASANLVGYVASASSIVTFTFAADIFPLGLVGTTQQIRLSGVNGKSKLNGTQTVVIDSTRTCHTYQPLAVVPYSFGGKGSWASKTFVLSSFIFDQKISERKTGAPLLEEHGRAKRKPRV